MTPKEKAEELYRKYWGYFVSEKSVNSIFIHAKKCALIAVDEILNNQYPQFEYESDIEYWREVKKEIKKL